MKFIVNKIGRMPKHSVIVGILCSSLFVVGLGTFAMQQITKDPNIALLYSEHGAEWIRLHEPYDLMGRKGQNLVSFFRVRFDVNQVPSEAVLKLRAMKAAAVFLDEQLLFTTDSSPKNWKNVFSVDLTAMLTPGRHELRVAILNQSGRPTFLAYCEALNLFTGEGWEASSDSKTWDRAVSVNNTPPIELSRSFQRADRAFFSNLHVFIPIFVVVFIWSFIYSRQDRYPWVTSITPKATTIRWILLIAWGVLAVNNIGKIPLGMGMDIRGHWEYVQYVADNGRIPFATEGWQMFQSPLFYIVAAVIYKFFLNFFSMDTVAHILRVIPLVCGAIHWSRESAITLTGGEREFLDAGLARRQEEEDRERDRLAAQERLERTARWRTRGMVAAVSLMVVVIGVVAWAVTRPEGPRIALVFRQVGNVQSLILDGWEQAQREFDFEGATVVPLINPTEDMQDLAEAGYELIISGLFDKGAAAYSVAEDFPDTHFVQIDAQESELENVTTFDIVREEGAYLVGAAAALQSETGRIGFIGGVQQDSTERRRAAYTAGARSIDPNIEVDVVYLGPYHDPNNGPFMDVEAGRRAAEAMYRSGVDVIHHSAGDSALELPMAAAEVTADTGRNCWVVGSEVDERRTTPEAYQDRFLTSMWKRWDQVVFETVSAHLAGELLPGRHELGIDKGAVDYATDGGHLSPSHLERLEEIKAQLLAGSLVPATTATEAPRWTREPEATVTLIFDGRTCSADVRLLDVAAGTVVMVNIVNESDEAVEVKTGWALDDDPASVWTSSGGDPWAAGAIFPYYVSTFTAPGATNALSGRFGPGTGSYVVDCFADGSALPGIVIAATFEPNCEGPAVESDDPVDVIRALEDAINARDPDAVCSLFSDTATAEVFDGDESDVRHGDAAIAEKLAFPDDLLWFRRTDFLDIETSGDAVTWRSEWSTYSGPIQWCNTAEVENRQIITFERHPCETGD